jgi:periplasmic divalent cation tolerance protein
VAFRAVRLPDWPQHCAQPDKYLIAMDILILVSTCPDASTAERIARELVDASLVACVNIVPGLRSIYRWNGAVQADDEVLMILKTPADRLSAARERLVALHPYDVPEVVALPVADGHHPYLQWVIDSTRIP